MFCLKTIGFPRLERIVVASDAVAPLVCLLLHVGTRARAVDFGR